MSTIVFSVVLSFAIGLFVVVCIAYPIATTALLCLIGVPIGIYLSKP